MTLIRAISDLHLERGSFVIPNLPTDRETILIDAGDLSSESMEQIRKHFGKVCEQFKHVIFVLGNHDYYGHDYLIRRKELVSLGSSSQFQNLSVLDNDSVRIEGVQFIGATMWSSFNDGSPVKLMNARNAINDFHAIRHGSNKFHPIDAYELYRNSYIYLTNEIEPGAVVVTHNAPSEQSTASQFRGDPLNYLFCNSLETFIERTKPQLWVHGHTHSHADYMLGETRIISNPRGYQGIDDNTYVPDLVINITVLE